jgi:adenylate cyclase
MKNVTHWIIGLSTMVVVVLGYWVNPPVLHRLEILFQDAHFQIRGPQKAGPEVVIAAIDEKSLDELGRWPWPRKTMAQLVEKLVEQQVKVIAFDMVFSSPDENSGKKNLINIREQLNARIARNSQVDIVLNPLIENADNDAQFAAALRKSNRSILGYYFDYNPEGLEHLADEELQSNLQNIQPTQFNGFIKSSGEIDLSKLEFKEGYAIESSISVLSKSARSVGYLNYDPEVDGTLRKLPLIVKYKDKVTGRDYFFPPLSMRILERYLEGNLIVRVGELGAEKVILDAVDSKEVPINNNDELLVNFLGKGGTFPHISISDLLHDRQTAIPKGSLKDKIVIIGATATGLRDIKITPFDSLFPGVEVQATVIDNILHSNLLSKPDWILTFDLIYLVLFGIFLTLVYPRLKPVMGVLTFIFVAGGQFGFSHWIFVNKGLWVTDVFPLFENILIFSSLTIYGYLMEKKERHFIENTFGKYMSPNVIDKLLEDPSRLNLGGKEMELTALFTDLGGFTACSEQLSAEELVNLLNEYLTQMTGILLKYEGTLDKYDGDAIKAFFGAPVYFKDHARRACWVAVEMQEEMQILREKWAQEKKPELNMRVGINTGVMVVGNMGSKNRMNYGMNGDSVNLAARLEGANKEYGTFTLISESTYEQARDFIEVREIDTVRVVGRSKPTRIYELLGKKGTVGESIVEILPLYKEGLKFYKKSQWKDAIACFEKVLEKRPEDGPSLTLLKRCQLLQRDSQMEKDWDGIFSISSK